MKISKEALFFFFQPLRRHRMYNRPEGRIILVTLYLFLILVLQDILLLNLMTKKLTEKILINLMD